MPRRRYIFTPDLDRRVRLAWANQKTARTAAMDALVAATGWPRHMFKNRAVELGITAERRRCWTASEDKRLLMDAGSRSIGAIARELGRSYASVKARAESLRLSVRITDGYGVTDLRRILGAPYHRVADWMERGLLPSFDTATGRRVSDEALVGFIYRRMEEIDFRLADQDFLKGVFSDGKRKRLSQPGHESAARRGDQARHQSRGSAGNVQRTFAWPGGDERSGEPASRMGQEDARLAATA